MILKQSKTAMLKEVIEYTHAVVLGLSVGYIAFFMLQLISKLVN